MFHVIHMRSLVGRGLASYIIIGREVGENGTRHIQGYAEFPNRLRLNQLRLLLPDSHIEARRGNAQEARDYCTKDGDFDEYGEIQVGRQGARSDLEQLHQSLLSSKRKRDIADDHFGCFIKYPRGILLYLDLMGRRRSITDPPSIIVYHGKTGTGKTRAVWENAPNIEDVYPYPGSGWFDGYDNHPIVLFDDFGGSEFKISYLLKLLDRYPFRVPVKGGFAHWCPSEIYITSNLDPHDWFPRAHHEHVDALFRRFTHLVKFE